MTEHFGATRGRVARFAPVLLAFAALAGCGNGTDRQSTNVVLNVGRAAAGSLIGARGADTGGVTASDAELRNFHAPLLVLTDIKRDSDAVIGIVSDRDGNVIWQSADQLNITLRDGLLVASRGFGDDLMSAHVPDVRAGTGEVVRDHYYLGGNELIQRSRFFCQLTSPGSERVVVTGVASTARLVVERCQGDDEAFENRYWIEAGGLIRKSIQWLNPTRGSFRIEVVPRRRTANVAAPAAQAAVTISE